MFCFISFKALHFFQISFSGTTLNNRVSGTTLSTTGFPVPHSQQQGFRYHTLNNRVSWTRKCLFLFSCLQGRPTICIRYKAGLCLVGKYSIKQQEINIVGILTFLFDSRTDMMATPKPSCFLNLKPPVSHFRTLLFSSPESSCFLLLNPTFSISELSRPFFYSRTLLILTLKPSCFHPLTLLFLAINPSYFLLQTPPVFYFILSCFLLLYPPTLLLSIPPVS